MASNLEKGKQDQLEVSKVLVLFTGGTIGMVNKGPNGAYEPKSNYLVQELKKLTIFHDRNYANNSSDNTNQLVLPCQKNGRRVEYEIVEYDPLLDSSNIGYDDYAQLAKDIEKHYDQFDGFVILHGTDTMTFTASALSFMLENLGKPVVITGSQIPIFEVRSDGIDNFLGALVIAGSYKIPEVTVFFHDVLLRGNRTSKVSTEWFDAFKSPNMQPLAEIGVNIRVTWDAVFRKRDLKQFEAFTNMCRNVGVLRFYPGITESTVNAFLQPPMKGVVLQTYGAGNGPSSRHDIMNALREASSRGVIIVNCTQVLRGKVEAIYSVGKDLEVAEVIAASDMTVEAALMKLSYLLGKNATENPGVIRKHFGVNLRGEMTVTSEKVDESDNLPLINKLAETKLNAEDAVKKTTLPYLQAKQMEMLACNPLNRN